MNISSDGKTTPTTSTPAAPLVPNQKVPVRASWYRVISVFHDAEILGW